MTKEPGAVTLEAGGIGRYRDNFAVHHLMAAARFSRETGQLEAEHHGKGLGNHFHAVVQVASAAVLSSCAALEAYINELFLEPETFFPEHKEGDARRVWDGDWKKRERKPTLEKYELALDLRGKPRFRADDQSRDYALYQSADILIQARNALMHFKPQWHDQRGSHQDIAARLQAIGVHPSPFLPKPNRFPMAYMSHSMSRWAVETVLAFTAAFSQRSGLRNGYDQFISQLDSG